MAIGRDAYDASDPDDDWDAEDWEQHLTSSNSHSDDEDEENDYDYEAEAVEEARFWAEFDDALVADESASQDADWRMKALEQERVFTIEKKPWAAVRAATAWRKAGDPMRAISFVRALRRAGEKFGKGSGAALLTTIAGSHYDLGRYEIALHRASVAISYSSHTHHAHRVAGAALRKLGRHQEADYHFDVANDLERQSRNDSGQQIER